MVLHILSVKDLSSFKFIDILITVFSFKQQKNKRKIQEKIICITLDKEQIKWYPFHVANIITEKKKGK